MSTESPLHDLPLRQYVPESTMVLPEHHPQRAVVPAVDVHNHLGRWHRGDWTVPSVPDLVATMDEVNVGTIVNLDGCWDAELEANLDRYDRAFPGRFLTFCRVDWSLCSQSDDWPSAFAASVRDSAARGAGGLKLWKDIGLRIRDRDGALVLLDDPRLEPMWEALAETRLPVLVHTADPAAFFRPVDERNERLEQLLDRPDWQFHGEEFPSLQRLLDALESAVAAHPAVTFIGAHVGCYVEDLQWVDRMLTAYENFNVDLAARVGDLGRQPRAAARLMTRHPTRVLLGTDAFPPRAEDYRLYYRFLATDDEYFPYSEEDPPGDGRWRVSGLDLPDDVLRRVVGDNARALIPALTGT
ncbi:MAG: amidohydrolase family protein [Angustibacter sp.]